VIVQERKSETALTEEQETEFHTNGYLVLRHVFGDDEVSLCREEAARLLDSDYVDASNLRTRSRKVGDDLVTERFDPIVDISPVFAALSRDERILAPIRQLYGDDMLLFKDKLIFKLSGMTGYTMHQDWAWWQPFPRDIVSVTVAIDGADAANGALEVFSGYQDRLLSTPGELRNMNSDEIERVDVSTGEILETRPGDVILFHCLTPHQSGPNTSDRSRRQLYLSYCAAKHGDLYQTQADHYRTYNEAKMTDEEKKRLYLR
jgi:ectoine hydroxylase-related dioxygenase (phytanoyl-CoA dioxygenase family)